MINLFCIYEINLKLMPFNDFVICLYVKIAVSSSNPLADFKSSSHPQTLLAHIFWPYLTDD